MNEVDHRSEDWYNVTHSSIHLHQHACSSKSSKSFFISSSTKLLMIIMHVVSFLSSSSVRVLDFCYLYQEIVKLVRVLRSV